MGDLGDFWRDVKAHKDTRTHQEKQRAAQRYKETTRLIKRKAAKLRAMGFDVHSTNGDHVGELIVNKVLRIHPYYKSYQILNVPFSIDRRDFGNYKDLVAFVVEYFAKEQPKP